MVQTIISHAELSELDETALVSTDGGVFFEAVGLGMAITYGIFEAYQWGRDYADSRLKAPEGSDPYSGSW